MKTETRYKSMILILTIVALGCLLMSDVMYFAQEGDVIRFLGTDYMINNVFFMLLRLSPCVLLLIYICKYRERDRAPVLYPILCGLIAGYALLQSIRVFGPILPHIMDAVFDNDPKTKIESAGVGVYAVTVKFVNRGTSVLWSNFEPRVWYEHQFFTVDWSFLCFVPFVLLTVDAARGLKNKLFTYIAVGGGVLAELAAVLSRGEWYTYAFAAGAYADLIQTFIALLGGVALFAALLLFGMGNQITFPKPVRSAEQAGQAEADKQTEAQSGEQAGTQEPQQPSEMTLPHKPEQRLEELDKELALGVITEEEYQILKADITGKP